MSWSVYLGFPTKKICDDVLNNYPLFDGLVKNLEEFESCTIDDAVDTRISRVAYKKLPAVGSTVLVDYVVDPSVGPVKTEWQVLGYNMSIPERIKYKNGNDLIYVTTIGPGGLLSSVTTQTSAFGGKTGNESYIGTVESISQNIVSCDGNVINGVGHTYGNNCPYDAPTSVTVGGKEYSFAGWNMTLMSKCGLAAKYNNKLFVRSQFRSYEKSNQYRNDWSTSEIREWMNGSSAVENQKWYPSSGSDYTTGTITGLFSRLPDEKFLNAVSPCVNRTWVYGSWISGKILDAKRCEHVVDKFWLLGEGNINTAQSWMEDDAYDTSKFTGVFTSDTASVRKRNYMNEDGSEGSACDWWLRSADSGYGGTVGCVSPGGGVYYNYAHSNLAYLPVCLIQ